MEYIKNKVERSLVHSTKSGVPYDHTQILNQTEKETMKTFIDSNGSKWAGQAPDSIDKLIALMEVTPLSWTETESLMTWESFEDGPLMPIDFIMPMFGPYTKDIADRIGTIHFSGNFHLVSHCFSIYTDDDDLIESLRLAIKRNKELYLANQLESEPNAETLKVLFS